ncbi:MAG: acyl-CoA dehydrogenase family protein [Acidimicrobiales bacterium]
MANETGELAVEALLDNDHPIKRQAAAWAADQLDDPRYEQRERACEFWAEGLRRIAGHGVLGILAPVEHGGRAAPMAELLLVLEGLGYGCEDYGLVFAAGAQVLSTQNAVQRFGTDAQRAAYLAPLVAGTRCGRSA